MAWKVGITEKSSVCERDECKKFGNLRCFPKNSDWFDSPRVSNFTAMTKKLYHSLPLVSIGYPLLIFVRDPFSTKLTYNQKKNELAE